MMSWQSEIVSVIVSFDDELASFTRSDFEFIGATGKSLCVPDRQNGFKWSGRALKNLAGSGQVCVRLIHDLENGSCSDDALPSVSLSGGNSQHSYSDSPVSSPEVTLVKVEPSPRILVADIFLVMLNPPLILPATPFT